MSKIQALICFIGINLSSLSLAVAADETLTFQQAITLAISRDDPSVAQYRARAEGVRANALAESQLPDPVIKFGVANMATDSFRFNQEPMTQMQFKLHQSLPSAAKRRLVRERGDADSEAYHFMAAKAELEIAKDTGRAWLKLKYFDAARAIVDEKRARLVEMLDALGAQYESGHLDAQQILAMEAELALLEDKLQSIEQEALVERAHLGRYIGDEYADANITGSYSDVPLPVPLQVLEDSLQDHPDLMQEKESIRGSEKSERIAKESYKPTLGFDLGYGYRAGGHADMATAMISMDLPIFTGKRQDKRLFAAKKSKQVARLKMQTKELDMIRNLRSAYGVWQRAIERIALYNTVVLERTKSVRIASENAYASGSADFAEIIRTHLSELDARLNLQAIELQRALAQVELIYYQGNQS